MLTKNRFVLRKDLAALQASQIRNDKRIELRTGERYITSQTDTGGGVLLASGNYANPIQQYDRPSNQTGTAYTLALGDEGKTVWMNNAAANVLTIPENANAAFDVNTTILIMMEGTGVTSVKAAPNVTLNGIAEGEGDLTQYSGTVLVQRSVDVWVATPLTVA